ncbi:MAG: DNA polymerase, partial [Nitrosopumilaceae archaeon]
MIALRGLSPMKRERYFTVAAFDTETEGLDGKLLLVQSYKEGDEDAKIYYNMKDFLNYIFSFDIKINSKIIWYAHNLEYDWRYLLDSFKDFSFVYKIEACESTQGKFFQFIIREKTTNKIVTRFRDSMALYPASLQNFTSQFAPKNMKQNIGLGDGIIFDYNNPKHINYAKNDVISLVHAIINFDTLLFEKFHVHVKGTTASTALTAWLRTISKDQFHRRICNSAEDFIRKNYYGGVVQLNVEPSKEYYDIHIFDINSSYPFVMKNGVPFGQPYYTEFYKFGYPGFYRVLISIPENEILPIIGKRNYKTLLWPCGTFETFISSVEIEYAKKLKYKIEIYEGYFFPKILDCFSNFVNQCEKLRNLYKNEATEIVVKLMQNSLYGKFGMRKEGREILIA